MTPPTIKIHGSSTAPKTAPKGAVPQRSFMMEAKIRRVVNNETKKKPRSMVRPLIPATAFKIKTIRATQKKAAKQTVIDVVFGILSSTDKKNRLQPTLYAMSHLTEPGIKNLFIQNLNECKQIKLNYHTKCLNLALFIGFFVCLGILLYVKYKGRLSDEEKESRKEKDRLYILNQIKMVQIDRQKTSNELITNLPTPESPLFYR